jgi:hypothetical protein
MAVATLLQVRPEVQAENLEDGVKLHELVAVAAAEVDDATTTEGRSNAGSRGVDVRLPDDACR